MASKTVCPITRAAFFAGAQPLPVRFHRTGMRNVVCTANPKAFDTGSVGWCLTGKVLLPAGGTNRLAVQVSLNITAIGSKELAEESVECQYETGMVREDVGSADAPSMLHSRTKFVAAAPGVGVAIGNDLCGAQPREFSSGKVGWYYGGKVTLMVAGTPVKCQVGINLVAIGSEQLPKDGIPIADGTTTTTETTTQATAATQARVDAIVAASRAKAKRQEAEADIEAKVLAGTMTEAEGIAAMDAIGASQGAGMALPA